jgi:DNA primase small subunit
MDPKTLSYLKGRFSDYYRQSNITAPPKSNEREWAFIPWTEGSDTIMARHRSLLDLGQINGFLEQKSPRHMYMSAAKYKSPSAENSMGNKDWKQSDLIFDLDSDHDPQIDPETQSKKELLSQCKSTTQRLIEYLETEFAFDDISLVFSGNRGYHVHIRDQSIQHLNSDAREDIADYVTANNINISGFISKQNKNGVTQRHLRNKGGWGKRLNEELVSYAKRLDEMPDKKAINLLTSYNNIGKTRSKKLLNVFDSHMHKIANGNMEVGGSAPRNLFMQHSQNVIDELAIPIDAPVTTDTHRLIRLPRSLHGGSGLIVKPTPVEDLDDFNPLTDTIPDRFKGRDIDINVTEAFTITLNGKEYDIKEGDSSVPEFVGIYAMCDGKAKKVSEL